MKCAENVDDSHSYGIRFDRSWGQAGVTEAYS